MGKQAGLSSNRAFSRALFFLFAIPACGAVLVNITIDSNNGDPATGFKPIYQPQNPWADQTCSGCYIQPDAAKAFKGTWEAATYHPELQNVNLTLQFTGVAIWVFFILSNANDHGTGTTTNTQVNITLDGHYAGNFSHDPDLNTHDMIYNATIFSTGGLSNTSHTLVVSTNDYPISTFLNFDWAVYSVDVDAPASQSASSSSTATLSSTTVSSSMSSSSSPSPASTSSSSKIGIIVGCTIGAPVVIALALVFITRQFRPARPVQNTKPEGILEIDVPPRQPPGSEYQANGRDPPASSPSGYTYFSPSSSSALQPAVRGHAPDTGNTARLREMRQMEIDARIQSAQREIDNLKAIRNARSSDEMTGAGPSTQPVREMASLRNEVQQLRDQIGHLQAQRQSDWALGLSNENDPLPPAYTRQ